MFKELGTVVFTHNFEKYGLQEGDIGTVIHSYNDGKALEVEVVKADGSTLAVLTLEPEDIRNMTESEILKVREVASVS